VRRPGGYLLITEADGSKRAADTFTCKHCNSIVVVPAKASPAESGGWCGRCAAPVCARCAGAGRCTPFEKKLELAESRARMLAAITGS
jgi:hypothetical protein